MWLRESKYSLKSKPRCSSGRFLVQGRDRLAIIKRQNITRFLLETTCFAFLRGQTALRKKDKIMSIMTHALYNISKKAFTWSVVLMTILWSMGVSAFVPLIANAEECPDLVEGDLFQVVGDPNKSVFILNADMEAMYFPHATVYETWYGTNWSIVTKIPKVGSDGTSCADAYPAGKGVNYRPGSRLVGKTTSANIYAIGPDNMKHKIGSAAVAKSLYGDKWENLIADLPPVFDSNLKEGDVLDKAIPHDGMLVKVAGDDTVYAVEDGMYVEVEGTLAGFLSKSVQTVSEAVFNALGDGEVGADTKPADDITADPTQGGGVADEADADSKTDDKGADTTPAGPSGKLTIALAADTPNATFTVGDAVRVPFTKVNLTASGGDVTITSFKIKRTGAPAVDGDFSKVNVVDANGKLLNDSGKSLNSDSIAIFSEDIVVPKGETKTYTIVGDMVTKASLGGGNLPKLALFSVETASTVVGTLPLEGNVVQVNANVALGTVTLAEGAQVGTVTEQVGKANVQLADLKVTVSANDFQVEKIVLNNSGSSADDDVQNIVLKFDNNTISTGTLANKYVTFDLASCGVNCKIEKGKSKNFAVYGDVVKGSTRTINLDVKAQSHVLAKDLKYGYYALPTNNASALTNTITISQGKLTVSKTNDVVAGDVPEDSTGVKLGSWNFKVQGEPITVNKVVFKISTTGTVIPTGFDSLALYTKEDKALTGGSDGVGGSSSPAVAGYATSTDAFTLPVGDNILYLKAKIDSTPVSGDTVVIDIDMSNTANFDATGQDSSETITLGTYALPQATIAANTQTIKSAALRVTTLATPPSRTLAAGTTDVQLAHMQFDASNSSEDLKVTQFKFKDITGGAAKTIDIQNMRLQVDKDGDSFDNTGSKEFLSNAQSGSDSTAGNDETITFNLSGEDQFLVKAGKKSVVYVIGNIAGSAATGATATHNIGVSSSDFVAAVGTKTSSQVTEVIDTASGQTITVGTAGGQVQVSIDSGDPNAANYAAGTKGVTLAVFNFLATTTEDVEIATIKFTQRVTPTASSSFKDYDLLYVTDEAGNNVGSVTPTTTTPVIDLKSKAFIVSINNTAGKLMYLKADLSSIGTNQNVTVGGHRLGFNIGAGSDVIGKGAQTGTGATEFLGANVPNGKTHYMYSGVPTISLSAEPGNSTDAVKFAMEGKLAATADMFKIKVSANTGDVGLYKFTFDVATTSVNLTQLEFYDITDTNEILLFSSSSAAGSANYTGGAVYEFLLDDDNPTAGNGGEEWTVSKTKPRYFVLRGTFTGVSSGDSVTTRLAGDAALPTHANFGTLLMASSTAVDAEAISDDDFIWSDRSASGHSTSTDDWINGYLVNGLTSVSSTAKTLSL